MSQTLLINICMFYFFCSDLAKFKGLLLKIKVIKGFSAKLKVLKDCNQIKGFKGSTRGPANGLGGDAFTRKYII